MSYHSLISSQSDPFTKYWKTISDNNSQFYHWLDGEDISIYSCQKLQQLKDGLKQYLHPTTNQTNNEFSERLKSLNGFLINWPINFLKEENLFPSSITYLPFVNTNLWL